MNSSPPRRSPKATPLVKRDVTENIQEKLRIFSLRGRPGARAVGSLLYKTMTFPSDVDAFEMYDVQGTPAYAASVCARALKRLVTRVLEAEDCYWVEAKVGRDLRYTLPECEYEAGRVKYNVRKLYAHIASLAHQRLISVSEARKWKTQVRGNFTYDQYAEFQELFYNRLVLRWTINEIIDGQKTLHDGRVISLMDAIQSGGDLKIDGIVKLGARWVEISNFVVLKARGKAVSTDPFARRLVPSVALDILSYLNPQKYKAMKIAKRLWSIATYGKDNGTLYLLSPLMSSDAARLHQLQGTVEAVASMKDLRVYKYGQARKDIAQFAVNALVQIDNPTFISEEEKKVIASVIVRGDYETAVKLISIKTDEYARNYLVVTGLMDTVLQTVASNYNAFQVCD